MKTILIGISIAILSLGFHACKKPACEEKPQSNCNVTFELNRVCGCNDVTYDNPSIARCNGIEDFTEGACEE